MADFQGFTHLFGPGLASGRPRRYRRTRHPDGAQGLTAVLPSAVTGLSLLAQDPVHRRDGAVIAPGIQLAGPDLCGRQFGVLVAVHQLEYRSPLFGRQSRWLHLRGTRSAWWRGPEPAVVRGA
ncbi:hypothetical protein [Streptomyces scopuliridis]|uniref:hypothetical protein n=1 Tax=Streptomyces scopuliridis TaxID=452529 RepID=UPI003693240E